jgi:hypothetical protein
MATVLKDTPKFVIPYGPREVSPDMIGDEDEGNFCSKSALEKYSGWLCAVVLVTAVLYFGGCILWFLLKK